MSLGWTEPLNVAEKCVCIIKPLLSIIVQSHLLISSASVRAKLSISFHLSGLDVGCWWARAASSQLASHSAAASRREWERFFFHLHLFHASICECCCWDGRALVKHVDWAVEEINVRRAWFLKIGSSRKLELHFWIASCDYLLHSGMVLCKILFQTYLK